MLTLLGYFFMGLVWYGAMVGITRRVLGPLLDAWNLSDYGVGLFCALWPLAWTVSIPRIAANLASGTGETWSVLSATKRRERAELRRTIDTWRQLRKVILEDFSSDPMDPAVIREFVQMGLVKVTYTNNYYGRKHKVNVHLAVPRELSDMDFVKIGQFPVSRHLFDFEGGDENSLLELQRGGAEV
jgi:hypothetical protein